MVVPYTTYLSRYYFSSMVYMGVPQWLILQFATYPTSVTGRMPAVSNINDPPGPEAPPVVLYEMMLFYKASMENAQAQALLDRNDAKRARLVESERKLWERV